MVHGLSSWGMWAPEQSGSVVEERKLNCLAACGILVRQPGAEPMSSALQGRFLTAREVPGIGLLIFCTISDF